MKKAFDQTVRDLKRGVNKKVLKVPSIEQKVLDATSNEPWGPHGSLLADIALASRNYHEYQMIMSVIWKRVNDTGKNWRHVYKALTVLEYLVAHGSERVIDDIREHAYQISTLSDFQYIDSSGKDQGNNVRRKSQSLVVLVNDKDRIQEVRQKAASNRDKYRNTSSGSMYRPSSGGYGDRYDDDRYESRHGNRDDDRNGYGRERDWGSRDDGRSGDSYGRDGYRGDDFRGRGQSVDDYRYGSRSRSADRDQFRAYDDDGQYSSRGSGAKTDDHSQEGSTTSSRLERRYSEQNLGAPPSYEEAVGPTTRSPSHSERDGESPQISIPKASSPPGASPTHTTATPATVPTSPPAPALTQVTAQDSNKEVYGFDEFDPRGSFTAAPTVTNVATPATSVSADMDFLGSLSESYSANSLALVLADEPTVAPESNASANFSSGPTFGAASSASTISNQPFDDPFGDGPFRAAPSTNHVPAQQHVPNSFNANSTQGLDVQQPVPPTNSLFGQQELSTPDQDIDILAGILPPSASSFDSQTGFSPQTNPTPSQTGLPNAPQNSFQAQTNQPTGFLDQTGQPSLQTGYPLQSAGSVPQTGYPGQQLALTYPVQAGQASQMGYHSGQPTAGFPSQIGSSLSGVHAPFGSQSVQPNPPTSNFYGSYNSQFGSTVPASGNMVPPSSVGSITQHNFLSQPGSSVHAASQIGPQAPQARPNMSMAGSSALVPQPSKDKFETKSTVWADTLSRGLVNLNISGAKTNPLADIGVDFDAINRKEKRMEKPTTAAVTSTITMGKAMGSGSGIGRAGAGIIRPPSNPTVGPGMNGGPGGGMAMGGYGVSQPMGRGMGMGMGMGMNMPGNMGMRMNMGMGQSMQQQTGFPPGSMPGGYNPAMGSGNYGQQPYGGGYRSS